jgi:hypothetical protein
MAQQTQTTTVEVEVFALVDADGNVVASHDPDLLGELYEEHVGAEHGTGRRVVKLVVSVPVGPVVLRGTVPAEPEATLSV